IIDLILAGGDALKHFTREIGDQRKGVNPGEPIVVPTHHLRQGVRATLHGSPSPATAPAQPQPALATPKDHELTASAHPAQQAPTPASEPAVPPSTGTPSPKVHSNSSAK